jgi:hypothetical protein
MRCKLNNVCIVAGARTDNGTICTTVRFVPAGTHVWDFLDQRYGLTGVPAWVVDRMRDGRHLVFFDRELVPLPPLDETVESEMTAMRPETETFSLKSVPQFPAGSKFWDVEDKAVVELPGGRLLRVSLADGSTTPFPRSGIRPTAFPVSGAEWASWLATGRSPFEVTARSELRTLTSKAAW